MPVTFSGDQPSSGDRIITPSWSFNRALRDHLGNEGLPAQNLIELFGPKGVGKTSLALSLLGCAASSRNKGVSICDLEIQSRDTVASILEKAGYDGDVHYIQQQAGERSEDTVERFVDRMYDMDRVTYQNPDVGLFDSIGAYRPSAEFEGKIGDANMGIKAREMGQIAGRFIRSLQLAKSPHVIIMTNHEHLPFQSIGHAPQPETGGGETKKYLSQIRIRVYEAWIKKEKWKQSKISGSVKLDGAWLLEGKVKENRSGISDQVFWAFMIGGEGLHGGLTAMIECLIMGHAESSAQSISESAKITLDGKSYGKFGSILKHRDDLDMFVPFQNRLRVEMVEDDETDTESVEVEDKPKKKRGK